MGIVNDYAERMHANFCQRLYLNSAIERVSAILSQFHALIVLGKITDHTVILAGCMNKLSLKYVFNIRYQ